MNSLLHGDVLEFLKEQEEESIDLCITDPPYRLNKTSGSSTSSGKQKSWCGLLKAGDKRAGIVNDINFREWLPEVYRVLRENSHFYVFVNDKNVQEMLNEAERVGFRMHNILVWKKNNCTPNRWYMKNCEFVLFFYKGKAFPIENKGSMQFLEYRGVSGKQKVHPTEKPVEIMEHLVGNSSKVGELVKDPFCSTGAVMVAAKRKGRWA